MRQSEKFFVILKDVILSNQPFLGGWYQLMLVTNQQADTEFSCSQCLDLLTETNLIDQGHISLNIYVERQ